MNILRSAALALATAVGAAVLSAAPPALASTVHIPTTTRIVNVAAGSPVRAIIVLPASSRPLAGHRVAVWAAGIGSTHVPLAHGHVDGRGRLHVTVPDHPGTSQIKTSAGVLGVSLRGGLAGLRSAVWTRTEASWGYSAKGVQIASSALTATPGQSGRVDLSITLTRALPSSQAVSLTGTRADGTEDWLPGASMTRSGASITWTGVDTHELAPLASIHVAIQQYSRSLARRDSADVVHDNAALLPVALPDLTEPTLVIPAGSTILDQAHYSAATYGEVPVQRDGGVLLDVSGSPLLIGDAAYSINFGSGHTQTGTLHAGANAIPLALSNYCGLLPVTVSLGGQSIRLEVWATDGTAPSCAPPTAVTTAAATYRAPTAPPYTWWTAS